MVNGLLGLVHGRGFGYAQVLDHSCVCCEKSGIKEGKKRMSDFGCETCHPICLARAELSLYLFLDIFRLSTRFLASIDFHLLFYSTITVASL